MDCERTKKHFWLYLLAGASLGIALKLFALDILHVSGASMEPALPDNSVVLVNKLAYGLVRPGAGRFFIQWAEPRRGEIVIFLHDDKIVVKRCVAAAGDRLDFLNDSEYSLITGDETISLSEYQYNRLRTFDAVPEGYILAVGDNRAQSVDSREYGFVSVKNITGRIIGR